MDRQGQGEAREVQATEYKEMNANATQSCPMEGWKLAGVIITAIF